MALAARKAHIMLKQHFTTSTARNPHASPSFSHVQVWTETMVVLTHAHAAKAMLGQGYDQYSRQRRNIVVQLIKQAAGSAQVRALEALLTSVRPYFSHCMW
jgi:hypothetical protein